MPTDLSPRPGAVAPSPSASGRRRRPARPFAVLRQQDAELRQVVLQARSWGLAQGHGCGTDALTVVVGLALAGARAGRVSPRRWTIARVQAVLRADARSWCVARGVDVPVGLGEALVLWFDFLDAHRSLGRGSDTVAELRRAATDRRARAAARAASRRRHPAGRGSA